MMYTFCNFCKVLVKFVIERELTASFLQTSELTARPQAPLQIRAALLTPQRILLSDISACRAA